ncbi:MAG TPA: biopolymer transporter ExbD [Bdellovibrionota bacterium]|nr:biopolymer transporter ExbD [Bdellovibrionota bacterium]
MKKSFLGNRTHLSDEMSLQITSMADIFIIILVFLLKSYSTGAMNLAPTKGMTLPSAKTDDISVEALKVEISETAVQIEGQPIVDLQAFRFDGRDLQSNGSSIKLMKAIDIHRQRQLLIAKANSSVKIDPKIIILADQKAPYTTVKTVLASAALNGYTDFKLAVVKGE